MPERHRRLLAAGTSRWNAADPYGAMAVLEEVVSSCKDPLVRCDAIAIRSEGVAWMIDEHRGVDELAAEANVIASIDPARAIGLYIRAALHSGLAGRPGDCQQFAQSAFDVAEPLGPMVIAAQAVRAMSSQRLGDRDGAEADLNSAKVIGALPIEMLDATLIPIVQAVALPARISQERWSDAEEMLDLSMVAARHHGLPRCSVSAERCRARCTYDAAG